MTPNLLDELEKIVALSEKATPGEWGTDYRKTARGYAQEVFDADGSTIATMAWHAVPLNETTTTTDREPNAQLIAACVNFLRTHAPAIADMAKRLEAAERDAARYRWLRERSYGQHKHPIVVEQRQRILDGDCIGTLYVGPLFGDLLDAAIDATQEGEG